MGNGSGEKTFFNIIATIGAILIFVGFAWLIAKNWHQIPNFAKVLILVIATLSAFISGVILKENGSGGAGRGLITLGALLYILSVFLIAQIYSTSTTLQGTAWLLLMSWTVVMITAYALDSVENLLISLITFFIWLATQYGASIMETMPNNGPVIGVVLLFLGAGALLYGMNVLHKAVDHKFSGVYRFWSVFYFLAIFYVLSFQSLLPILAEWSFNDGSISLFLISFVVICFLIFMGTTLFAADRKTVSTKTIIMFLGAIALIFVLVLSTKVGAGLIGYCYPVSCYDFDSSSACAAVPDSPCRWDANNCEEINCWTMKNETECVGAPNGLSCEWFVENDNSESPFVSNGYCQTAPGNEKFDYNRYDLCNKYNNQKESCMAESICKWQPSLGSSEKLPTSLWLLWIINNIAFLGFIIVVLWYGQAAGSSRIINLGLIAFILDIASRYIGFWMDYSGYFAFSILAILGGLILIAGAWYIPKWRKELLSGGDSQ
jgi:uncharacterized membrane protein